MSHTYIKPIGFMRIYLKLLKTTDLNPGKNVLHIVEMNMQSMSDEFQSHPENVTNSAAVKVDI